MFRRFRLIALALPIMAGCYTNETLDAPDLSNNNGLFSRFIAIGTSISAGLQSAGINDSTQQRSFQVLVAQQAGAAFYRPSLNLPGCPAPFVNNVSQARVGGASATACSLRQTPIPYQVDNLAVPGLTTPDLFTNVGSPTSTYERLQVFFLGGQTPWNAVKAAQPTLLSIEIGSSDVIGAVASLPDPGDPDSITPYPVFAENYTKFADSVVTLGTKVVAFTIPDVTQIPVHVAGQPLLVPQERGQLPRGSHSRTRVPSDLHRGEQLRAQRRDPRTGGARRLGARAVDRWCRRTTARISAAAHAIQFDCSNTLQVVTPEEYAYVRTTTGQMNQLIRQPGHTARLGTRGGGGIFAQLQVQAPRYSRPSPASALCRPAAPSVSATGSRSTGSTRARPRTGWSPTR